MAEAVNFALPRWLKDIGPHAKSCLCVNDSVRINMSNFLSNLKDNINVRKYLSPTDKEMIGVKRGRPNSKNLPQTRSKEK